MMQELLRNEDYVVKKISLIMLMLIGVFMMSVTIGSLGEQGNRVMNFLGRIFFLGGTFYSLYLSFGVKSSNNSE